MQTSTAMNLCLLAGVGICLLLVVAARKLPGSVRSSSTTIEQQEQDALSAASLQQAKQGSVDAGTVITEEFCLHWLHQYMPERDRGAVSEQRLRKHIRLALAARRSSPWAAAVPVELWLNDVLPYRSVDEPLDEQDWRPMFYEKFMPMVSEARSLTEAAQILNRCVTVQGCCFGSLLDAGVCCVTQMACFMSLLHVS
jgi:hypothetical protein